LKLSLKLAAIDSLLLIFLCDLDIPPPLFVLVVISPEAYYPSLLGCSSYPLKNLFNGSNADFSS